VTPPPRGRAVLALRFSFHLVHRKYHTVRYSGGWRFRCTVHDKISHAQCSPPSTRCSSRRRSPRRGSGSGGTVSTSLAFSSLNSWGGKLRRAERLVDQVPAGTPSVGPRSASTMAPGAGRGERAWALAFARAEGISVRKIGQEAGLSPTQGHQLTPDGTVNLGGGLVIGMIGGSVCGALRGRSWWAPVRRRTEVPVSGGDHQPLYVAVLPVPA
jgi:hypothetical protein